MEFNVMQLEGAIKILQKTVKSNNEVVKEARKNGDINVMQLTADLDNQSIATKTVLQALESYKRKYELAIEQNIKDYKNSIPKKKIKEVKKKIEKAMNLANECIEESIVVADSDSLNFGRKQAHNYDIELLQELLKED